ncbi:hypothetical protein JG688_00012333 [Phytophthora aleatoria]|uniref:Uncharacterized protein n=1 Tax=Phytophthora aleatoria TaxID=2496075 RepID=A0A8J5MES4_9STRA|nr:hypothetical protein JG688_00012333 [Phytophthora aleatoria]
MDASDKGLCILEPSLRQYIRVRFTPAEREAFVSDPSANSINVHEFQSAILAALHWGPIWAKAAGSQPVHVSFWIDNASAVSWTQRRSSQQPLAQMYNRLLALAEFNYSLVCTAKHISGVDNVMANAGSRAWSRDDNLFRTCRLDGHRYQSSLLTTISRNSGMVLRQHAVASTTFAKYYAYWHQWVQFSSFMR